MPEEMRAALDKFFAPHHYKMKRRGSRENFGKIKGLLFLRFGYCKPFERGRGQISLMPSWFFLNTQTWARS